jgi:hypothetical protein
MVAESAPPPIASPEPCLELFLSNQGSNNRMNGNVTRLRVIVPNHGYRKIDTEY